MAIIIVATTIAHRPTNTHPHLHHLQQYPHQLTPPIPTLISHSITSILEHPPQPTHPTTTLPLPLPQPQMRINLTNSHNIIEYSAATPTLPRTTHFNSTLHPSGWPTTHSHYHHHCRSYKHRHMIPISNTTPPTASTNHPMHHPHPPPLHH